MSKITSLTPSWREWIISNLRTACAPDALIAEMVKKDFDPVFASNSVASLATEMVIGNLGGEARPAVPAVSTTTWKRPQEYVFEPSRIAPGNVIRTSDQTVRVQSRLTKPEVIVFSEVLTEEECAGVDPTLRRKTCPFYDCGPDEWHNGSDSGSDEFRDLFSCQ